MARPTRCVAQVEPDGKLALPPEVTRTYPLRAGEQVELVIGRFTDAVHEYWQQVAEFEFPQDFQEELHRLLRLNATSSQSPAEAERLDQMIEQVEWQTAQRARARLELQRLTASEN